MADQISLFPVDIAYEEKFTGRTAHLKLFGDAITKERYAIKTVHDHPLLPITELFCYQLCSQVGIPTPGFAIVRRPNGELAFGSRVDTDTRLVGQDIAPHGILIVQAMAQDLSAMYALDWFLPNPDRHANNILYRKTHQGNLIPLAFDWSMVSSLSTPAFSQWPWATLCNSAKMCAVIKQFGWWDYSKERELRDRIRAVSPDVVRAILQGAPDAWKPQTLSIDDIINWWGQNASSRAQVSVS
jgi:hypothetical protein